MTGPFAQLALTGTVATLALAMCLFAVRHLDPATALSAPRRTRGRFRWHLNHAPTALALTAAATAALLLTAFLL